MVKHRVFAILTGSACFFALCVIALGAWTRLMDAGLGCPDWPGCYGHWIIDAQTVPTALMKMKAWAEMIHRYAVGLLSILISIMLGMIFFMRQHRTLRQVIIGIILIILLCYQILLGQWTVTLQLLPTIVTQHLLGGFLILATLWTLFLNQWTFISVSIQHKKIIYSLSLLSIVLLLTQIFLGAWTSTHYAALSCPDFPFCQVASTITFDFKQAFNFFNPIGVNYEGGVLAEPVRQLIQMVHRIGAGVILIYLFLFLVYAATQLKHHAPLQKIIAIILGLLLIQIGLGIANVILQLPVIIAVSHTLVAALLLLALITFAYRVRTST